jgi:hypothetical protein
MTTGTRSRKSEGLRTHLEALERACRAIKRRYPHAWPDELADIEAKGVPELTAVARKVDAEPTGYRRGMTAAKEYAPGRPTHAGETAAFLRRERMAILGAAETSLCRAPTCHYAGTEAVRQRLTRVFDVVVECVDRCDLVPIVEYVERIADERYVAGHDLSEVQIALNSLEEATWSHAVATLEDTELTQALALVSTVLGAAKDALARRYVLLAARSHAPSLDVGALFAGSA